MDAMTASSVSTSEKPQVEDVDLLIVGGGTGSVNTINRFSLCTLGPLASMQPWLT
jgi:hypothetical protein